MITEFSAASIKHLVVDDLDFIWEIPNAQRAAMLKALGASVNGISVMYSTRAPDQEMWEEVLQAMGRAGPGKPKVTLFMPENERATAVDSAEEDAQVGVRRLKSNMVDAWFQHGINLKGHQYQQSMREINDYIAACC